MDFMALIAAFGGGIIGAYIGALPAFVMTGVFALIGSLITAAGAADTIGVGILAFGSFVGPHIAFAGGVAAAAYAGRKKKLASGTDICTPLITLKSPDVLLVGGIFGVLGFAISFLIGQIPFLGANTDLPGITVVISAIIARFAFGNTGLLGKYTGEGPRTWITTGTGLVNNIVHGAGMGLAIGFIAVGLWESQNLSALNQLNIIVFGFSAITLVFTECGVAVPATHHITLPSAYMAMLTVPVLGVGGALLAAVVGAVNCVYGDFIANTFNSHCDSHIDPPASTIFLSIILVNIIGKSIAGLPLF